ncbi:MAG: sigma-54-dependent Fis family transcriptional regulator [Rhodobiaceae bacterium]|nr:sigma-54-dependent Fis family transcriptional regulator [Rhodobiaceae bacterium]MCC0054886.1 sigma-54-dependent Fis family transcriptional regulator [Rhodobiaceae bacterium]
MGSISEHTAARTIAFVGGDSAFARRMAEKLPEALPFAVNCVLVESREEFARLSAASQADIAIIDLSFDSNPARMIAEAAERFPVVLALSDGGSVRQAVNAVRHGAADFLIKPLSVTHLADRIGAAAETFDRPTPVIMASGKATAVTDDFEGFIGNSRQMAAVYDQIRRVAPARGPVFITGESGTGKEVCANAIHARSNRSNGPLIAINCAAIPRDLMESELFGHVRGAFTGAHEDRPGAAELADGGTLFLDEICEMDLALQTKLLRFVQSGTLRRVGDNRERKVNVRIVAATNRDPLREIQKGNFREDLYYRLHVLPIHLPPLRLRETDIMPLATAFLLRYSAEEGRDFYGFDFDAEALLMQAPWPGNVRQLENTIQRIVVMNEGTTVNAAMMPANLMRGEANLLSMPEDEIEQVKAEAVEPLWRQEKRIIEQAITRFGGNIAKAAAALEVSPSTIYRKRMGWAHA